MAEKTKSLLGSTVIDVTCTPIKITREEVIFNQKLLCCSFAVNIFPILFYYALVFNKSLPLGKKSQVKI